jgi:hypothetical protein
MMFDDGERPRLDLYVTPISFIGHGVTRLVIGAKIQQRAGRNEIK